jgi:hypothetical protein
VRLTILLSVATFAIALPLGLIGCGDDTGTAAGGAACYDYASFNATTPAVSFKTDVLPIFRQSCGLSGVCHGDQGGPVAQPYLGPPATGAMPPPATDTEIKAIFAANVDADAVKAPGMKIVKPSDPENSFLMHKVDGTLTCDAVTCDGAACGVSMPQGSGLLAQDKRDTIRRWIAQGAKND